MTVIDANVNVGALPLRTKAIIITALAACLLFLFGMAQDIYWLRLITKPLPVLLMAVWLLTLPAKGRFQWAVITGLFLSALGDVLLELEMENPPVDLFVLGLSSFFLAHVAYIIAFLQDSRRLFPLRAALSFGYGVVMFAILYFAGDLGGFLVPVLLYVVVICTMLWRAAARYGVPGVVPRSGREGLWGALLFVLSDSVLALNRFAFDVPFGGYIVIITYWMGQSDITLAAGWQKENG
jgi:uncharacterized membrane protein YhhN